MSTRTSLFTVLLCAAAPARAQVLYGTLTGTVTDSSGAVVPAASVTATNQGNGQSVKADANDLGIFTMPNLTNGVYDVEIAKAGFRPYSQKGIPVTNNAIRRLDVVLNVGQITEAVTIQAAALALQTDKTDVSAEMTGREVRELPLPRYRNFQSLLNLVPGVTPGRIGNSIQASPGRGLNNNVNGVNSNNNANRIDGAYSIFLWLPHNAAYIPPAETIDVVNIATNNFDAEQGMAGGAVTNVTSKSGTNELHGSAFWFHDNKSLQARNFFNSGAKPNNITNIAGVTLGGPIRRNKLFYFGGWERNRERLGFSGNYTLPTEAYRRGDFADARLTPTAAITAIYDPLTGNAAGAGRTAFPGNAVPLSRQSAITRQMQSLLPAINRTGVAINFFNSSSQKLDRDNLDFKVDWQRTDTHRIWGKYSTMIAKVDCAAAFGAGGGPGLCQGNPGLADNTTQVATIGHNKTITPTFLWDGVLGWNRIGSAITGLYPNANFGLDTLKIPGTNGPDPRQAGAPIFSVSGYSAIGSDTGTRPAYWNDSTFTLSQNFGWLKSSHDIRFGLDGARHHLNHYQPEIGGGPQGRFNFAGGSTGLSGGPAPNQFNAYAGFLLGLPESMSKSVQYEKSTGFNNQYALYLRDRWQVKKNLTLTLGMRWEYYPLMTRSGRGGLEVWDRATNLVSLGGIGGNPKSLGITTSKKMFAPRVGFAWRATQKMVVRSGYGITYNPMPLARPLRGFYPLVLAFDFVSPNTFTPFRPIEQGIPPVAGPDLNRPQLELPATAAMRWIDGKELNRGYVQSWNFIIERELPGSFLGSVGYVGTATVRQFSDWEINAAGPGGGQAGRPFFAAFRRTGDTWAWNGRNSTSYHSLQTTINRRVASGLTVKGAYTYSKAINMVDNDGWTSALTFNWAPAYNRNRAQAGYDMTHNLHMGWLYELPFGKSKRYASDGMAAKVLGGWAVNGVAGFYSGTPFTVTAAGTSLNAPGNTQTADQVKPVVEKIGGVGPGQSFYDRTAFAPVADVRFGSTGRNILRGPGRVNFDFSLARRFQVSERIDLRFTGEAYNAFNTPHFSNPGNSVNAATFMQVTGADQDQRQFRFSLRLGW
ncbi:MAG: hypothetical protein FJW39_14275 [Acidobacteria bacterium]|nr:hypothetical protein [Acidobacteriota bacterium]